MELNTIKEAIVQRQNQLDLELNEFMIALNSRTKQYSQIQEDYGTKRIGSKYIRQFTQYFKGFSNKVTVNQLINLAKNMKLSGFEFEGDSNQLVEFLRTYARKAREFNNLFPKAIRLIDSIMGKYNLMFKLFPKETEKERAVYVSTAEDITSVLVDNLSLEESCVKLNRIDSNIIELKANPKIKAVELIDSIISKYNLMAEYFSKETEGDREVYLKTAIDIAKVLLANLTGKKLGSSNPDLDDLDLVIQGLENNLREQVPEHLITPLSAFYCLAYQYNIPSTGFDEMPYKVQDSRTNKQQKEDLLVVTQSLNHKEGEFL